MQEALERVKQGRRLTKWIQYLQLHQLMEYIYKCFTDRKKQHDIAKKNEALVF